MNQQGFFADSKETTEVGANLAKLMDKTRKRRKGKIKSEEYR